MQAVVLCGGLATRLGVLAKGTPKSLIRVADRPFIAWQLERLRDSGFERVLLCTGHLGDHVVAYVGDGSRFELGVSYAEDGAVPLGTAGALRAALEQLDDTFLVTYGDSYLPFDYSAPLSDLERHPEALGTMAVYENGGRFDASNTQVSADRVLRYEKGSGDPALDHIDYGATALRKSVIAGLRPGVPLGLDSVQATLAREGTLRAFRAEERFYEMGSAAGLAELDAFLRDRPER